LVSRAQLGVVGKASKEAAAPTSRRPRKGNIFSIFKHNLTRYDVERPRYGRSVSNVVTSQCLEYE
jgi:hypothetical protein